MRWFSRMRTLFRGKRLADEHEEELQFHLAMREQWKLEQGLPHGEARRDARIRFGSLGAWRERMSEIDLMILPQTVLQDLRYGARILVRNVGFTSAAVLALAIGIGANTAAFTAYKAFFKRPLEGRDTGRLVNVALNLHSGATLPVLNLPDYEAYRNNVHAFSGLTASSNFETLTLTGAGGVTSSNNSGAGSLLARSGFFPATPNTELASVHFVANNYFSVLGAGRCGAGPLRKRTIKSPHPPCWR
jgi:hypothetical protein